MTIKLIVLPMAVLLMTASPLLAQEDDSAGGTPAVAVEAVPARMFGTRRVARPAFNSHVMRGPSAAVSPSAEVAEPEQSQAEETGETTQTAQDPPAAPALPEGQSLGGAGLGSSSNALKSTRGNSVNGGGGGGSGGGGGGDAGDGAGADPAAAAKLSVFPSWKSLPHVGGHGVFNFKGPGTGAATHFAASGDARFTTCETVNSTDNCQYRMWISAKPGASPVGKNCSDEGVRWTGGQITWSTGSKPQKWDCVLKESSEYFFNIQLTNWGPNPNAGGIYACEQFLDTTSGAVATQ